MSIAAEEELKSVKRSAHDGKSQKSFARSVRSRRNPQQAALIEDIQNRLTEAEATVEDVKGTVDIWAERN